MIIGFDAKRAVFNKTGLGNYSRLLIDVLAEYHPRHQYMLYTPSLPDDNAFLTGLLTRGNVHLKLPHRSPVFKWKWRSGNGILKAAHRHHCHIFHGLSGELPRPIKKTEMKSVVTIHDLIFKVHPEYYNFFDRIIYDHKARRACQDADRIIATSECTKRDIMKYYGIDDGKINVVYQGCQERFYNEITAADVERVRIKYELPRRFILSVGTIEERKNLQLAVEAMKEIEDKHIYLVVVGHRTPYYRKLKEWAKAHGVMRHIYRISHVRDEDLPVLYHLAQFSVYASRYEGFGIPVVESIASGTPVIAAKGSCLEEAGGEGAIYVDPDSKEEMVAAMNTLLGDEAKRREMVIKGKRHIEQFSGRHFADATIDIYHQLLEL